LLECAANARIAVVMGVSGAGKTTIAQALAQRLDWNFEDGDTLHPPENVAKMSAGQPLDETGRAPWIAAIAARLVGRHGHFMPGTLLDSQFAALEVPGSDEHPITVSIDRPVGAIVDTLVIALSPLDAILASSP